MCKNFVIGNFCVGVRYFKILHYWENYFTLKIALFLKVFLFPLRNCLFLKTALHCNFTFSVETVVLWKTALLENCVTLKNCVTWKLCCFEKLRYLKTVLLWKLRYLKIVLLWKIALLENCVTWESCVTWKLCYLWKILRWGALLLKVTYW